MIGSLRSSSLLAASFGVMVATQVEAGAGTPFHLHRFDTLLLSPKVAVARVSDVLSSSSLVSLAAARLVCKRSESCEASSLTALCNLLRASSSGGRFAAGLSASMKGRPPDGTKARAPCLCRKVPGHKKS